MDTIFTLTFLLLYSLNCVFSAIDINQKSQLTVHNNANYKYNPEYTRKFSDFKENSAHRNMINHTSSVHHGPSKISELTQRQFEEIYLTDMMIKPPPPPPTGSLRTPIEQLRSLDIPQKLDWRYINNTDNKFVTPVKNQRRCGGCWAFSTIESVETMYAFTHGVDAPRLSVQEVIDCAVNNYGCEGGDTCFALDWMVKYQPTLVSDAEYPLTEESNSCRLLPVTSKGISVMKYTCNKYVGNEDQMLLQLYHHGPLTVSVDATTWNHYLGGIIQYHCASNNNHAVQIVGYDLTGEIPYYIVRNSWGTDFGIDGYLHIKIGDNLCGIAERVSTVTVQ